MLREDAEQVERLAAALEARGIGTWIDRHKIKPRERWEKAIEDAIRSGAFFVACFSRVYAARTSSYMNEELYLTIKEVRRGGAGSISGAAAYSPMSRVWKGSQYPCHHQGKK
jgi:hypothetical protein